MDGCLDPRARGATSDACAACYQASVLCNISNCVGECIADPGAPACIACRCGANAAMAECVTELTACSGVPSSTCD